MLKYILLLMTAVQPVWADAETSDFEFPQVKEQWLRAAPPNANMLAAYALISNHTEQDLKLVGAFAPDFKMAEIHKTVEVDGMLKMREQKQLDIAKKANLLMEPGGLHIMLMMPKKKFSVGEGVRICLVYLDNNGEEHVQHLDFPVLKK